MKRGLILSSAAYGAMAIFSFGHAAASSAETEREKLAACNQRLLERGQTDRVCFEGSPEPFVGLAAAALWPLYWSWQLQS